MTRGTVTQRVVLTHGEKRFRGGEWGPKRRAKTLDARVPTFSSLWGDAWESGDWSVSKAGTELSYSAGKGNQGAEGESQGLHTLERADVRVSVLIPDPRLVLWPGQTHPLIRVWLIGTGPAVHWPGESPPLGPVRA